MGNNVFRKSILVTCFKALIPMILVFSLMSLLIYLIEADKYSEELRIKENNILKLQESAFKSILSEHVKNALFLAELIPIENQPGSGNLGAPQLVNAFARMIEINTEYDQIRWIDKQGMERLRINQWEKGVEIVPADQLQDKSGRYYVREGLSGPRVYTSKFDLNVEHGHIQMPLKPMLRITATVQDENTHTKGLVVLNIKGRRIIDSLQTIGKQMAGALALLNSDGYWLISPNPQDEWAFMYPDKIRRTFQAAYPELWPGITGGQTGQFATAEWLVTFATVDMDSFPGSVSGNGYHAAESWKIVSLLSAKHLVPLWRNTYICGVVAVILFMAGACFYWSTARVNRADAMKTLLESEEKFRMVTRTMGEAVIMIDDHCRIRFWSDSARRMLGYPAKETLGRRLYKIIGRDPDSDTDGNGGETFWERGFKAHGARLREANALRKDGDRLPVDISIMPVVQNGDHFAIAVVRDLSERKMAEAEKNSLLALSTTDGLTGLANRRCFDEVLHREHSRHSRSGEVLSLIFVDIDYFKAFNDTYGHINGDRCLKRVARVLGDSAHRSSDLAARYGGEEFAMILPKTGNRGAMGIAEMIRKDIAGLSIPHQGSKIAPYLTVSMGIATVSCRLNQTPEFILSQVDEQLYKAKTSGRNRIESLDLSDINLSDNARSDLARPNLDRSDGRQDTDSRIVQLIWKSSFHSGNDLIDSQHMALFDLSNQMFAAVFSNGQAQEISDLFAALLENLRFHFQTEEKVMGDIGYSGMLNHAREHARLLDKAVSLSRSFDARFPRMGDTFHFFINEIIVSHMIGMDREFYPFLTGDVLGRNYH